MRVLMKFGASATTECSAAQVRSKVGCASVRECHPSSMVAIDVPHRSTSASINSGSAAHGRGSLSRPLFAGIRSRIRLTGDLLGVLFLLLDHEVARVPLDDLLDLRQFVPGDNGEVRRHGPHRLVLDHGHRDLLGAGWVAAFAVELGRVGRRLDLDEVLHVLVEHDERVALAEKLYASG